MIQSRKKDYLQRIIEEFFSRLQYLKDNSEDTLKEKNNIVSDCFNFFYTNLGIRQNDNVMEIIKKVNDMDLLEQYAKLLLTKYEVIDIKDTSSLYLALDIVLYLESADKTLLLEQNYTKRRFITIT